jgi:LAGLIDADG endonuclease
VDLSERILRDKLIKPTLNDTWLSGFTDADGCFNVKIEKRSNTALAFAQEQLRSCATAQPQK